MSMSNAWFEWLVLKLPWRLNIFHSTHHSVSSLKGMPFPAPLHLEQPVCACKICNSMGAPWKSRFKSTLLPALCPTYPTGVLSFFLMGSVTSCALGNSLCRSASFAVLPNPVMYRRSGSGSAGESGKADKQSSSHSEFKKKNEHEDVTLVEFMYLVFIRMPDESYCRRLRSLLLYVLCISSAN